MSAPTPRESDKTTTPTASAQPVGAPQRDQASANRTRLYDKVRRTEGFDAQQKLYEREPGPEPSPEVEAEIEAERQAKEQCGPGADANLLAELLATESRVRPLIQAMRDTSRATIAGCAAAMRAGAGEVVAWATRENKALIELFSEYAATLEGGEISGDAMGVASVANMLNPLPQLKTVMSIVLAGAGFAARDYNRKLAQWRKSETGAELTRIGGRVESAGQAQVATWQEMFNRLADGTMEVSELSFQAGQLSGLLDALRLGTRQVQQTCRRGAGPDPGVAEILKSTMAGLKRDETTAREHLAHMVSLPGRMAAENRAGLDRMKGRYVAWLAQQGAIKVRGRLFADRQAGADVLHVNLEQVVAIEGLEASGFSPETAQTICSRPGRILAEGGTLALTLDSVIHGYRVGNTRAEGETPAPETFQGELNFRIGPQGLTGTTQGFDVSTTRLEQMLRARQ